MLPQFSRRSEKDLEAAAKLVIITCINSGQIEADMANEMKRVIGLEPTVNDEEDPLPEILELPQVPYPDATERQIAEYRSFLLDAAPEYKEHIEKKCLSFANAAKNLLTRIQMLHHIRYKIMPHPGQPIPSILGNPPAHWWGEDEDRDLMIGIMKYGYGELFVNA